MAHTGFLCPLGLFTHSGRNLLRTAERIVKERQLHTPNESADAEEILDEHGYVTVYQLGISNHIAFHAPLTGDQLQWLKENIDFEFCDVISAEMGKAELLEAIAKRTG